VPDLIAKPALGVPDFIRAGTTLAEAPMEAITSVAPYPGQLDAVGAALGLAFPAPNRVTAAGDLRLVWAGRDLAFLIGPAPDAAALAAMPAAVTDQSDAWVTLTLTGPLALPTLARLVSLDLRAVKPGECFRTGLNHLPLVLVCEGADSFRLMTFRSMAQTAWHELCDALEKCAARAA
jgi:heterotetrameric sarcosine oxidase gamma subunit